MALARRFNFHSRCRYEGIKTKSTQVIAIDSFSEKSGHPVHYLLYNPQKIPISISYPASKYQVLRRAPAVGCRVVPAADMHSLLSALMEGTVPAFYQIERHAASNYWRVEYWAADLMLSCKVGREFNPNVEGSVLEMIERRSGPIGAAIAVNIELPSE
jgi:hypothetical protein